MLKKFFPPKINYYIDLVLVLTQKDIKVKYKNNFLGYLWSVAHPLAFALIFYFVFKIILRFSVPNYALFLIAGLFPWQAFANSLAVSTVVFISNASLIKRVKFPRYFLVLTTLFNDVFHLLMSLPVIVFFLFLYDLFRPEILFWFFYIPLNLLSQLIFTFGLALMVGSLNVFFRDLERLVQIVLNLWFYFTPIIYSLDMVPQKYQIFMELNPLAMIVANWQNIFIHYQFDGPLWAKSMGMASLVALVGIWIYSKLSPKFSEAI